MIPYTAALVADSMAAAETDILWLKPASVNSIAVRRIFIGQYTAEADAQADMISVRIIRGFTTSPNTGGSAVVPAPLDSRRPAFGAQGTGEECRGGDTVLATGGTGVVLVAETFNVMGGWYWRAPDNDHLLRRPKSRAIWLDPGETLAVRLLTTDITINVNATIDFDEMQIDEIDN